MSDDTAAVGLDSTGYWWVVEADGGVGYRCGHGPAGKRTAAEVAAALDEGSPVGRPALVPPEIRPAGERVEVPLAVADVLVDDAHVGTAREAADGWDARLWGPMRQPHM